MHNGGIAEFPLIKRKLQSILPDVAFNMVQGNTGQRGLNIPVGGPDLISFKIPNGRLHFFCPR